MSESRVDRSGAKALAGFSVGVLVLDTKHELVKGNVQCATSFHFPVLYEVVTGVSPQELMAGEARAGRLVSAGARKLEAAGVAAIVGACGSFANYQTKVAAVVRVPVFMSILLEVPLLLRVLPQRQQLGIVFASTKSFTDKVREECGIARTDRIVAVGADAVREFRPILTQRGSLNSEALGRGVGRLVARAQRRHPRIASWMLQCSDLPPYAAIIQQATGRPVFDMVTLIKHVYAVCNREMWR